MAKVVINDTTLASIGDAIRQKTYTSDLYKPSEMANAIKTIQTHGDINGNRLILTGDCSYQFYKGKWNWFIEDFGDKITTQDLTNVTHMFMDAWDLESIPFDFNFPIDTEVDLYDTFYGCQSVKQIGKIKNLTCSRFDGVFDKCYNLKYLPEFENLNLEPFHNSTVGGSGNFSSCLSLREIPEDLLKQIHNVGTGNYDTCFYRTFYNCYALDEIRGFSPKSGTLTSNRFNSTFYCCFRAKDVIFDTQEDGTPYIVEWANQIIDLTGNQGVGWAGYFSGWPYMNAGITRDTWVTDDTTYQALKDAPDWWTAKVEYSRYNRISAVNTINSLPDTSAFLATNGGTNTIKFKGTAGSRTDGGAINTMTEEEIAVATAKGWTVTFA